MQFDANRQARDDIFQRGVQILAGINNIAARDIGDGQRNRGLAVIAHLSQGGFKIALPDVYDILQADHVGIPRDRQLYRGINPLGHIQNAVSKAGAQLQVSDILGGFEFTRGCNPQTPVADGQRARIDHLVLKVQR